MVPGPAGLPGPPDGAGAFAPRQASPVRPPAPASAATQVATFVTVSLAIGAIAAAAEEPQVVGFGVGALFVGVCFGLGLGLGRCFRTIPGWVAAISTASVLAVGWGLIAFSRPTPTTGAATTAAAVIPLTALVVLGLDWASAVRLRSVVVLSGLVAVPVVASRSTWALLVALAWFGSALVAFWSAQRDDTRAQRRPRPVRPATTSEVPASTVAELARVGALAGAAALALALLVGTPSCERPREPSDVSGLGSSGGSSSGRGSAGGSVGGGAGQGGSGGGSLGDGTGSGADGSFGGDAGSGGDGTGAGDGSGSGGGSTGGGTGSAGGGGGSTGGSSGSSGSAGGSAGGGGPRLVEPEDTTPPDLTAVLVALLAIAALVGGGLLAWPWLRRWLAETPPTPEAPWAHRLVRSLEHGGDDRGRPRRPDETITTYTTALAEGPLPDHRVAEVGQVLSAALFSGREPPPEVQAWAEAVLAEILEAHPPEPADTKRREPSPVG